MRERVFLAGAGDLAFDALPVLLLEDVGGALVAGEQVGAVLGADEGLERVDAGEQADEIVLAAEREDRVDQVVADAGFALLDLEAVGEELDESTVHHASHVAIEAGDISKLAAKTGSIASAH